MKLEGRHTYAAGREVVWGVLYDPIVLESILPGCEAFEAVAPDEYRVTLHLRVGPIDDRFSGTLWLERVAPFVGFDFQADGESPHGLVNAKGRVHLEEAGEGGTALCYEAEIEVGGRLATVTGRLLETTARAFARRSLEGLEQQVDMRTRIYTSSVAPAGPQTPTGMTIAHLAAARRVGVLLAVLLGLAWLWRGVDRRRTRRIARQVAEYLAQNQAAALAAAPGESGQP
jgi:carbon monoxide dehydrogenase subunit G